MLVTDESVASARRLAADRHRCAGTIELVRAATHGTWEFRCGCGEPVLVT